jgi:hypothetical protein
MDNLLQVLLLDGANNHKFAFPWYIVRCLISNPS